MALEFKRNKLNVKDGTGTFVEIPVLGEQETEKATAGELAIEVSRATAAEDALAEQVSRLQKVVGSPFVANTAASMTNTDRVYVYTGSESGYTAGNWYYYDGSAWVSGGVYNSAGMNTDTTLAMTGIPADAEATGEAVAELSRHLSDLGESITAKMIKVSSHNLLKSDSDYTQGSVYPNGQVNAASTLGYTDYIPVSEGDVVRHYGTGGGAFQDLGFRYICAYDSTKTPITASGGENVMAYTVPSGIAYIRATFYFNYTNHMLTINYVAASYEPYFIPYYIASDEFVEDVLNDYQVPTVPVEGYNLKLTGESGTGYYEVVGGKLTFYNYQSYRYCIIPLEQNTMYYLSMPPYRYVLTTDNDEVIEYSNVQSLKLYLNSGNATKLYLTYYYTAAYDDFIISKGVHGVKQKVDKPAFVSNLTQLMNEAQYACALPKLPPYFTVGLAETWYYKNILALPTNIVDFYLGGISDFVDGGQEMVATSQGFATNGYVYNVYDQNLALIDQHAPGYFYTKSDNVQSCSALVIGDSTVAQNTMTQKMLDAFTERNKVLTLLGTRGTAPNNHEGRAGWSIKDYCTASSKGGITNPFYNPTTESFDFSYYMTNQGYSSPDFVVIQLGINDLYGAAFDTFETTKVETANYLIEIINSIISYNSTQKIILNLPAAINSDWTKHTQFMPLVRNKVIRYNEYMMLMATAYDPSINVRCSNCHLVLNPDTDITDDVHPTATGYEKMAMEVVSQINCWQNA